MQPIFAPPITMLPEAAVQAVTRAMTAPVDLEFDRKTGAITALIVPGPGKFCFFPGRESEYIIPWCCICQIGDDIILVEVKEEKCFHKDHLL